MVRDHRSDGGVRIPDVSQFRDRGIDFAHVRKSGVRELAQALCAYAVCVSLPPRFLVNGTGADLNDMLGCLTTPLAVDLGMQYIPVLPSEIRNLVCGLGFRGV